jgi:hypothetical protein
MSQSAIDVARRSLRLWLARSSSASVIHYLATIEIFKSWPLTLFPIVVSVVTRYHNHSRFGPQ